MQVKSRARNWVAKWELDHGCKFDLTSPIVETGWTSPLSSGEIPWTLTDSSSLRSELHAASAHIMAIQAQPKFPPPSHKSSSQKMSSAQLDASDRSIEVSSYLHKSAIQVANDIVSRSQVWEPIISSIVRSCVSECQETLPGLKVYVNNTNDGIYLNLGARLHNFSHRLKTSESIQRKLLLNPRRLVLPHCKAAASTDVGGGQSRRLPLIISIGAYFV